MLTLHDVTYIHPNRDMLFAELSISINKYDKIALIGNNGTGKSTLLKIVGGILQPASGSVKATEQPYYVPQHFGQFNEHTVAEALGINSKLKALAEILNGHVTDANLSILDDDWTIEERCAEAFAHWGLQHIGLNQPMAQLSGGQKTKVFLAGIAIHRAQLVLMDEPSNHLDVEGRELLHQYINTTNNTLLVVSHDRSLLNQFNLVYELSARGITVYGGNYASYIEQKHIAADALLRDLNSKEKALRKAKEVERETMERQQRLDARGKKKQEKAGVPTIMLNTLRNNAERSTARVKGIHTDKIHSIATELNQLRKQQPELDKMKIGFERSTMHKGKVLVKAEGINFTYTDDLLWPQAVSFTITAGERLAINGGNGSGKTTLIKLLLGQLEPAIGSIYRAYGQAFYIDQDYSLIDNRLSVYQQAQAFNSGALQEHDIKIRLNRFLFGKDDWDKPCSALSGGEKMRLTLCALTISTQAPDMIILDEPTNNLDIQNIEILTAAVNDYAGTLIVVSHDEVFLEEIQIERVIEF